MKPGGDHPTCGVEDVSGLDLGDVAAEDADGIAGHADGREVAGIATSINDGPPLDQQVQHTDTPFPAKFSSTLRALSRPVYVFLQTPNSTNILYQACVPTLEVLFYTPPCSCSPLTAAEPALGLNSELQIASANSVMRVRIF